MLLGIIAIAGSSILSTFTVNNVIAQLIVLAIIPLLRLRCPISLAPLCAVAYLWFSGFSDHLLFSGFIVYISIEYAVSAGRRATAAILAAQWLVLAYGIAAESFPTTADGPAIVLECLFILIAVTAGQLRFIVARERWRRIAAQQQVEQELKSGLARYLHDNVASSLTMMSMQAETAEMNSADPDMRRQLKSITATGRTAIIDLHQLVAHLIDTNPRDGSAMLGTWHAASIGETIEAAATLLHESGYHVTLSGVDTSKRLSSAIEAAFFLAVNEVTANLIKHSPRSGPISITIHERAQHLVIEVINSRESTTHTASGNSRGGGIGLESVKKRMIDVGGYADIIARLDSWQVTLSLPLRYE